MIRPTKRPQWSRLLLKMINGIIWLCCIPRAQARCRSTSMESNTQFLITLNHNWQKHLLSLSWLLLSLTPQWYKTTLIWIKWIKLTQRLQWLTPHPLTAPSPRLSMRPSLEHHLPISHRTAPNLRRSMKPIRSHQLLSMRRLTQQSRREWMKQTQKLLPIPHPRTALSPSQSMKLIRKLLRIPHPTAPNLKPSMIIKHQQISHRMALKLMIIMQQRHRRILLHRHHHPLKQTPPKM